MFPDAIPDNSNIIVACHCSCMVCTVSGSALGEKDITCSHFVNTKLVTGYFSTDTTVLIVETDFVLNLVQFKFSCSFAGKFEALA